MPKFSDVTYSHLASALYYVDAMMERSCRPRAKKVLIVATDGKSNDDDISWSGSGLNGPVANLTEHSKFLAAA